MSGAKGEVAAQLTAIENRALYTHCCCHAPNLTTADTIKLSEIC